MKSKQSNEAPPRIIIHSDDYWMRVQDEALLQLYKIGEQRRLVKNARGAAMVDDRTGRFVYHYINEEY